MRARTTRRPGVARKAPAAPAPEVSAEATTAKTRAKGGPFTVRRPAVLFEGGPWDGWSRYLDDTEVYRDALAAQGRRFPYEPTRTQKAHPGAVEGTRSTVWVFTPVKSR